MVDLKVGDVIFFRNNKIYNKLVQRYNLLKYGEIGFGHVGIITKVEKDNVIIHEALSNGFVKNPYEKWWINLKIEEGNIKIKSPNKKITNIYSNAENYLGRGYAWSDIFFILVSFITNFKISFSGSNRLICSEAVSRVLYDSSNKKINLSEEYSKKYDLIAPMDIYFSKYLNG